MYTNRETRTLDDCRDKVTDGSGQANNGMTKQLELTSRGIEMLRLLNDAFDNAHDVRQLQPAARPSTL